MNSSLNHVYRIVWNATLGLWQVASEATRGRGKTGSSQQARKARRALAAATAMTLASPAAWAVLPTGGNVVAGSATISQAGSALNITQASDKAAINWQSFSIGQGNSVNFVQPSATSVALNRVLGNDVSVIQGAINANGQVFLVNQNGVLFTPTAQVNVGGIVASTQNISTTDFMAGKYEFSGNSTATVENQGSITAANGGVVALVAAKVINSGSITAPQGTVGLAAGNTVLLDLGGPVKIQVTEGALNAAIEQSGGIRADGGTIYLTAKAAGNLAASVINHSGVTRALTMASLTGEQAQTGSIALSADLISQNGTLDASGIAAGTNGGQVSLTAGLIIDAGTTTVDGQVGGGRVMQKAHEILQSSNAKITAVGATGAGGLISLLGGGAPGGQAYLSGQMIATGRRKGGQIDLTGNRLVLSGATLNSSGTGANAIAGKQRVGGGWQGNDADIINAVTTMLSGDTTLTNEGVEGMVVVWSDGSTTYGSTLNARGSDVEISGKDKLMISLDGVFAKSLLLDPKNIEIKTPGALLNVTSIANPNNKPGDSFGQTMLQLSNGNLVISAESSDLIGESTLTDVGRVYLYSSTGKLISTLSGSSAGNLVGTQLADLGNGNFVVGSSRWDASTQSGVISDVGAVTWVNGNTGLSGVVSVDNSLVGSTAQDLIGSRGILKLNGSSNYLIVSDLWNNGAAIDAGAVTWADGSIGLSGVVGIGNSLVGTKSQDRVGLTPNNTGSPTSGIMLLSNGNYIVRSGYWVNGSITNAGAVTWGSGSTGVKGEITSANSLVGSSNNDQIGRQGVVELSNGNYVVSSQNWNGLRGAVTWGSGTSGVSGFVTAENSLVGTKGGVTADAVGERVVALKENGNYVVVSGSWDNGAVQNVGAVTFGNGSTGTVGEISSTNSLIGSTASDRVGSTAVGNISSYSGVVALTNGNYVVVSDSWDNGAAVNAGAVTFGNGLTGVTGTVNSANSLVGTKSSDSIGTVLVDSTNVINGVFALTNGNYVVRSSNWDNGDAINAGAVTWGNGTFGTVGTVSVDNSLVGSTKDDQVGDTGFVTLGNGNYLLMSSKWDNGQAVNAGAVTWGDGTSGVKGLLGDHNSLIGSSSNDQIGAANTIRMLSNNNYLVLSSLWDNNGLADVGAATWGNGATGVSGVISMTNSLIGSTAGDKVGSGGTALKNGNYVVTSTGWDNNGIVDAGAATWGNGATGISGVVSIENSLVGASVGDAVGGGGVFALANGNYLVGSSSWDRGTIQNAGAITWANGASGITGLVSESNSLVGSTLNDFVGFTGAIREFGKNQHALYFNQWDRGSFGNAGAVVFGNSDNGFLAGSNSVAGVISEQNSILGDRASAAASYRLFVLSDGRFVVSDSANPIGGTIYITDGSATLSADDSVSGATFNNNPSANSTISAASILALLNAGTAVTLQANNDITVTDAVMANNASGDGGAFTLEAGRNINLNANISTDNGNFTAIAGSANAVAEHRDAGDSTITLGSGVSLNAGTGTISLVANNVGSNLGKFVNKAGATPFTAAKTFIYLPSFNTTGNNGVTHATLGGLTTNGKRYNTTFSATTGAPTSTTAKLDNLTGVNLLYAAAPVITVSPSNYSITYGDDIAFESSPLIGFVDGDSAATAGAVTGTEVLDIVGAEPVNGFRNAGHYNLVYKSGYSSDLGYAFADANTQINELTVTPRALTVTTNNFLSSATDTPTVSSAEGLLQGQEFNGLKFADNVLSTSFGQNTLASNYATTVVVPGATGSDLTVNRALTVNGLNLTLQSDKNINIRNTLTSQGFSDKVTLNYGQGAVAANNTADYNFGLSPEGFAGKLNIHAGQNLSTKLGSNGTAIDYTVITALGEQGSVTGADLQGMNGNLAGNFALGADINAASTEQWNNGAGFDGIGGITGSGNNEVQSPFTGLFTGLGHTVNGLTINRSSGGNVGLFDLTKTATLRDVGVVDAKVDSGFAVGALAGIVQDSMIQQVYSSGSVKASISSGGGLIGTFQDGRLKQAFSSSTVTGGRLLGGLIGTAQAANGQLQISEVFANGSVTGIDTVGGLMGSFSVFPSQQVSLTDAYATGNVTASESTAGGLIGAVSVFGGLIIDNVYATGNVTITGADKASAGGLIGFLDILSLDSPMGPSSGSAMLQLSDSFFDTTTTGQSKEVGIIRPGGAITVPQGSKAAKGLATAELQARATFANAGWNIAGSGGALPVLSFGRSATVWTIGALQTPVTVTFNTLTGTFTYKAAEYALSDLFSTDSLFGTSCEVCTSWTLGTDYAFSFDSKTVTGFTDAGTYNNIGVQILNQDFALAETGNTLGSLTIDRARITGVTGITAENRVYNGNTTASLNTSGAKFTGLLQNEAGTLTVATATGAFANKNVGDNKTVNINGITLGGTAAKNYVLDNSGTSTIPGVGLPGMPPGPPIIIQTPNTANTATTTANITRLDSVMWVGGATGNWFDAANWAGGAIPDLANVASVVLPANVKVTFNGAMDAVLIDTLGSLGSMDMVSGTLNVGTGGITLAGLNQTGGKLSTTGNLSVNQQDGTIQLGDLTVGGTMTVKTNGAISQLANTAIVVTGATSVDAGANDIALNGSNNDFGTVSLSGKAIALTDNKNGLVLGNINSTGNTFLFALGGGITQAAGTNMSVGGDTVVNGTFGDVTLDSVNNTFTGTVTGIGKDVVLSAKGALTSVLNTTGNSTLNASGNLVVSGSSGLGLTTTTQGENSTTTFGNTTVGGDLNVTSTGAVSQVADTTLSVKGNTAINAGIRDVNLSNAGNLFNSIGVTGGAVQIADKDGFALDTIKAASLAVKAGGAVTQVAEKAIEVTGATSVDAGNNDVTLANANNDFNSIAVTGKAASITDKNAVALDAIKAASLNVKAGGAVTQVADKAVEVTGATSVDAGANAVTLANVGNDFDSIAVTAGAASVADKNAVVLDAIKATSLTLKAGGAVTQVADKALEVTGATSVDAGANAVTLANAGNDFGSIAVISGAASVTDKNAVVLDATTASSLTVKAGGAVTQSAAATVKGTISVDATGFDVALTNAGNNFSVVDAKAKDLAITDAKDGVFLRNLTATGNTTVTSTGGDISQGDEVGTLMLSGTTTLNAKNGDAAAAVTLNGKNNTLTGAVTATGSDVTLVSKGALTAAVTATEATLSAAGNLAVSGTTTKGLTTTTTGENSTTTFGNTKVDGDLAVTSTGKVAQVAETKLSVGGKSNINAGTSDVDLSNVGNDFNSIAVTAGAASITDKNAVALDAISAKSLTVKASGAVTQVADKTLEVTGATSVDAGTNAVTLANTNNDLNSIAVTGGAVSINDKNAVALDAIKATSLTVKAGGAVTQIADKALEVTGATSVDAGTNAVTLANTNNAFNSIAVIAGAASITDKDGVVLDAIKATSLTVKAGGAVTQVADKALEVTVATSVDAGPNAVTLANTNNDFNSIAVTGGAVSINDNNAVALDAIKATSLTVTAGGAVTQVADKTLEVTGATSVDAGTNAVTLANTNNAFNSIAVIAGAASITDKDGVVLDAIKATSLTVKAGGAVTQVADKALEVTEATSVDAGTNTVTLANTNNAFNSIAVIAGAASITDKDGVALDTIKAASLTLTAGGAVTQVADKALEVTGATSVNAGTNAVTLANTNNAFNSLAVTAGAVSLTDKDGVVLDAIKATSLTVKTGGAVTQVAETALDVSGATSVDAGKNAVTLANAGNLLGSVGVTGGAVSITDKDGVALDAINATTLTVKAGGAVTQNAAATVSGATSVDAKGFAVTLTNAGNDFGSVGVTGGEIGGAVSIVDVNAVVLDAITASSLTVKAGGAVTQNAAATVSGNTNVDATGFDVSLTNAGNNFNTVDAKAKDLAITDATGGVFLRNLTATGNTTVTSTGGDISQGDEVGTLMLSGTTTLNAKNGDAAAAVTLNGKNNTLTGAVTATGSDVTLVSKGALTAAVMATEATLRAAGNLAVSGATTKGLTTTTTGENSTTTFGNTTVGTDLAVTSTGNVAQVAETKLSVGGKSNINAGTSDVDLSNVGNDFNSIAVTAGAASITDKNAVALDAISAKSLTVKASGAVTQNAAATVSGNTNVDATGFDVSLTNAGNNFGTVSANAKDLAIVDAIGGVVLGDVVATGNASVSSLGGAITQADKATMTVTGTTTANAGKDSVTLGAAGNSFTGAVTATGSGVTLASKGALTAAITAAEATLSAAGNLAVSGTTTKGLTTTTTGENSTTTFGNTKVDGDLTVTSTGKVAQVAETTLSVGGQSNINAGANAVDLSNSGNAFSSIAVTAGAASITDKDGVALDAIKATSLTVKAGGAVTQNAAASVSGSTSVDAKGFDVSLTNAGNNFGTVSAKARDLSIVDATGGVVLGDVVTTGNLSVMTAGGGDITQTLDGSLLITGTSAFDSSNNITLPNLSNNFVGAVTLIGNEVTLGSDALIRIEKRDVRSLKLEGGPNANTGTREAAIANAQAQTLEPKLDLQIEREALEERSGDIAPFIIAANQPRASGPAQLIVVNGGIRLPAGQQEEN